jgi:hypothetical protein
MGTLAATGAATENRELVPDELVEAISYCSIRDFFAVNQPDRSYASGGGQSSQLSQSCQLRTRIRAGNLCISWRGKTRHISTGQRWFGDCPRAGHGTAIYHQEPVAVLPNGKESSWRFLGKKDDRLVVLYFVTLGEELEFKLLKQKALLKLIEFGKRRASVDTEVGIGTVYDTSL